MSIHVIEISTEVYHLLQRRAPQFIGWEDEKTGPTQMILLEDDVYAEFIDRAIAHRQTLEQVVREACSRNPGAVYAMAGSNPIKQVKNLN